MFGEKMWVLDGGFATALELAGHEVDGDPLWSAKYLHYNPELISKVHCEFLNSGADIIITASYQASIEGFVEHLGISKESALKLIQKSVLLAKNETTSFLQKYDKEVLVAGSVGPYGACKADGSEYTGSYMNQVTEEELLKWHRPRLEMLLAAGVDLVAMETIPALGEAIALLRLLKNYPSAKAWVTFSCKDGHHTNYGDDFATCVKACVNEAGSQLVGIGVNCTHPSFITPLLQEAEKVVPINRIPRVIYPNSGEFWTQEKTWKGSPDSFMSVVKSELPTWISLGAKVIGGCCRVSPKDIKTLSGMVKNCCLGTKFEEIG